MEARQYIPATRQQLLQGRTSNTRCATEMGCEAVLVLEWLFCKLPALSHLCLPHCSSASTSTRFSSAQLVLLKELVTVILDYSISLNSNAGCISFLNTVLSVHCPKIHYSSTYKWSPPVLSPPLLLQVGGMVQTQTHSSAICDAQLCLLPVLTLATYA